jgi:glycosyltransferase involved in cell wall biosynthesis
MTASPAVSIVITAFNVTAYIRQALESVLAQRFTDFEVILVNDGCPDTENLEQAIASYRPYIRYIRQQNGGPSSARNTGVRHARAPVIALLDGDDAYLPDYLQEQMSVLNGNSSPVLVYPDMIHFGRGPLTDRTVMEHVRQEGEANFESLVEGRCTVLNCAMIRRKAILDAGMWDPHLRYAEDFDLWLRIAFNRGRIVYHRKPLALLRSRVGSLSSDPHRMYAGRLFVYQKLLRDLDLTTSQERLINAMIDRTRALDSLERGRTAFRDGDFKGARRFISHANETLKRPKLSLVTLLLGVAPRLLTRASQLRAGLLGNGPTS